MIVKHYIITLPTNLVGSHDAARDPIDDDGK